MDNLEQYLEYYWLENYLFGKVSANFQQKGILTAEEFLAIITWKSNRSKTKFNAPSKKKLVTRQVLSSEISLELNSLKGKLNCDESEEHVRVIKGLIEFRGIGIPVASAILAVCYKASLVEFFNKGKDYFGADPASSTKAYLKYCECCREEANKLRVLLRDFDRMLRGRDFYKGKGGLKELANELK